MSQVIQLVPPARPSFISVDRDVPAIRTDAVNVVFTNVDETLAAIGVADRLRRRMGVPLTLVHFRVVSYRLPVDAPTGVSPAETAEFVERLRASGIDAHVRVFLCRSERLAVPTAFKRRSLIVVAGRRSWWPTRSERWRRRLEAAGHFVVFVDTIDEKERLHA